VTKLAPALAALAVSALLLGACGDADEATATPTPATVGAGAPAATHELTGRIMGPAGEARDTVDQLNQMQGGYDE
jgi:hypothetical protein